MANVKTRHIISLVVGLFVGSIIGYIGYTGVKSMTPPLKTEYEHFLEEVYAYYLEYGRLPEYSNLSAESQQLVSGDNGITYTPSDGSSYAYDKRYPINVPLAGVFTFGLWWGGEVTITAEAHSPEVLIENATLRHR